MLLHLKLIRDIWKVNVRPVQVLSRYVKLTAMQGVMVMVIVRNCLSLSMGLQGVAAGANPSLVSGRG